MHNEFWNDPWITYRFRKYMANPKRWPWKNQREIKKQYQHTFVLNAFIGGLLCWPLGVWVGRRMCRTQGGVPAVPLNRFLYDFINLDPTKFTRSTFRFYWLTTMIGGGFIFGLITTSDR